jgi:hypothetical protein
LDCEKYKDKDHPAPGRWQIEEWKFNRCPLTYIDKSTNWWIKAYNLYKDGHMPNGYGWGKESGKFCMVMNFINQKIVSHQKDAQTKR